MSLREKVKQDHFSVAMYHSQTLQHIKDYFDLEDFVQAESYKYSIIIATSALGCEHSKYKICFSQWQS